MNSHYIKVGPHKQPHPRQLGYGRLELRRPDEHAYARRKPTSEEDYRAALDAALARARERPRNAKKAPAQRDMRQTGAVVFPQVDGLL